MSRAESVKVKGHLDTRKTLDLKNHRNTFIEFLEITGNRTDWHHPHSLHLRM